MKKFFSISREQTPIIITLLVVILLGAVYLFIYIPGNEEDLQREHFRWLQRVDDNIQKKIEGCDTLLSHLVDNYAIDTLKERTRKYIKSFSTDNFILFDTATLKSNFDDTTSLNYSGTLYSMNVYEPLQTFIVSASKSKGDTTYRVSMQYTFRNFIDPLLNKTIFDHYIVFSNHNVVYEDFPSGLEYKTEDSLLKISNGLTGASIIDEKIGGENYKMFLQPVSFGNNRWIVAGLHSMEKYKADKRHLPWGIVLFLLIIALGLFLFIPVLKIFNLGNNDRLRVYDAIELVIIIKLLMSLLFFCFFRLYELQEKTDTNSEEILAKKISSAFSDEIKQAYKNLDSFDLFIRHNTLLQNNIRNLGTESLTAGDFWANTESSVDTNLKNKLNLLASKLSKPEINWLDNTGAVKYTWITGKYNNPPANFKYRDYFQMVVNNRTFRVDEDTFYVDQVISRTSGSFRTIISKHSTFDSTVIEMGFGLKSVDDVIMPAGYTFAIIKDDGTVLYHSDKTRNLNENLKEEFSDSAELNDALQGRYIEDFSTTYYEREYNVLVQPIKNFPYFIVVMNDTTYASSRDIETNSFTAGMVILFLLFVLVDILIVILASSRRSYFKNRGIVKTWLWPRRSSHSEYIIITIANIIMIFLLTGFYFMVSSIEYFFMLLVSIPITSLFINALFALKYSSNEVYRNYKLKCVKWLGAILLVINILLIRLIGFYSYFPILIFELSSFTVYAILIYFRYRIKEFIYSALKKSIKNPLKFWKVDFVSSYTLMIFTRVLITSSMPVVFFYISSFNYEQNLLARYREYDFANKLIEKFPEIDSHKMLQGPFTRSVYIDSGWIRDYHIDNPTILDNLKKDSLSIEDFATAKIFNLFGLYNENLPANNDNFYLSRSADLSFYYNDFFDSVLYNSTGSKTYKQLQSGNYLEVGSCNFAYLFPNLRTFKGWMFWLLLILALTGFYFVILSIIKKIFAIKVLDISPSNRLDKRILMNIQLHKLIFAVGVPGEEKLIYVCDLLQGRLDDFIVNDEYNKTVCIVDFKKIRAADENDESREWGKLKDEAQKTLYQYFIIDHFEYKISNKEINNEKLDFLQTLIDNNKKIIILSTAHPASFLNSFYEDAGQQEANKKQSNIKPEDYVSKWNTLLGNAPLIFLPFSRKSEISTSEYISGQIQYSSFLQNLNHSIKDIKNKVQKIDNNELEKDLFSIKLQTTAYNFYTSLWYSLTKEEKFILYDLAEDGLINAHDRFTINILISKGLIIRRDGLLHLFNKSFRNFILTGIGDKEIATIRKQFKESSTWGKLRTPLVLIVVAILVFIFASQEGTFTKTIGYITLLTGSIPALMQLFSLFRRSDIKTISA